MDFINQIASNGPEVFFYQFFIWYFGWLPFAIAFLVGASQLWLYYIRHKWGATQKCILLAIDIPKNNAQSPKAVENMFSYLGGAHGSINLIEKWWEGKFQLSFSYEIVAIDGYIQFMVYTPVQFRDLIETSVYAQYPDAEISEVQDYVTNTPNRFPDEEYDLWGSEFILAADPALPIRLYEEFEHKMGEPETHYRDPMAALMDLMSSLRKGEQIWYQIIIVPINNDWIKIGDKLIAKILGEKPKVTGVNKQIDKFVEGMGNVSEWIYPLWGDIDTKKDAKKDEPLKMMNLKPGQKKQIEGAQLKISKLGFEVKIRVVYLAKKEVMNKPKAVNGFVGYIKQFNTNDLNGFKPDTKITMTSTAYFFKESRLLKKKNNIIYGYKNRSDNIGRNPWPMNVAELATVWHFPIDAVVKAPLVQRSVGRRVEPPMSLPMGEKMVSETAIESIFSDEDIFSNEKTDDENKEEKIKEEKILVEESNNFDQAPNNLPFVEETKNEIISNPVDNKEINSQERGAPPANLPFA